ncbi:MAG: response regulator [Leptolyngbyaceae bacterium]|nr:response regulator [Leptolyngbyaceae bacterium]
MLNNTSLQPCILIVEDEPRIASFLERGLRRYGYKTVTTDRGDCALDLVLANGFDLMLLDLGLPGKDGWAVLDEMQVAQSHVPVIVITAKEGVGDRIGQYSSTVLGYMMKPFRLGVLIDMIRDQLTP